MNHAHPCETCGVLVNCSDNCDEGQQTIVYCSHHAEVSITGMGPLGSNAKSQKVEQIRND